MIDPNDPLTEEELPEEEEGDSLAIPEEESEVEDTEDGGAIIKLSSETNEDALAHFANIVDEVDQSDLKTIVNDLIEKIGRDKEARKKRDKQYEEGLRRTGLGDDAPGGAAFSGSNRVVHPMLIEACVDFSARVTKELFPPSGPVKSKVLGLRDQQKDDRASRKAAYMNWQTTEQMQEFRGEIEQLTTQLPLGGGQYLKVMWNPARRRQFVEFVAIDDIYLPFAATNFYTAERKTHVQYITASEYAKRVKSGMYRDVDLASPEEPEESLARAANNKIEGRESTSYNEDGLRTIFEVYTHLDFGDGPEPYILSIDKSTQTALSLYRNWEQDDENRVELEWIVEFGFVPWRGAYPIGLTHMIGGLSGAATGALRALLDSAHIQNTATLLKLKGGPSGQTISIQPTEIVEMDGGALVDDIRKLAMPLPFAGPSPTLFQLLGFLVDAGKGVIQTSFEKLADGNPNAPVGTTFALIEQGMVVFSSIHSRLHASMSRVFRIMHRINSAYLTEEDIEAQRSGLDIEPEDFDGPMDVVPVSDPAIFSEAQRFAQVQALQARSAQIPDLYDQRKIEEMFLQAMKVDPKSVMKAQQGDADIDPVSENVAAVMGQPIYVLPKQDQLAHIQTHLAFFESPLFGLNPVIAKTYAAPMVQHLRDHLINHYLKTTHSAVSEAIENDLVGENDAAAQADLIVRVQRVIDGQLAGMAQKLAQAQEFAQSMAPQPEMPPDSMLQVTQMKAQADQQREALKIQASQQRDAARMQVDQQTAAQDAQIKQASLALKAQELQAEREDKARAMQVRAMSEAAKIEAENVRTAAEIQSRESMNASDNETALTLAAGEILSGEKFAVSTGTGINPQP